MTSSTGEPFDLERELARAVASGDPAALLDHAKLLTKKARRRSTLPAPVAGLRLSLIGHLNEEFKWPPSKIARGLDVSQSRIGQMLLKYRARMAEAK